MRSTFSTFAYNVLIFYSIQTLIRNTLKKKKSNNKHGRAEFSEHICTRTMAHNQMIRRSPHLVEDLQVERVHARWHCALDDFVPSWIFGPIVCGWCFIHSIAQSDSAVGIHPGHTVVFSQFGLQKQNPQGASWWKAIDQSFILHNPAPILSVLFIHMQFYLFYFTVTNECETI